MGYHPPGAGIDLSASEVEVIKGWFARGDTVNDVATRSGLKPDVVADILFGNRFAWVRPAETWELPDATSHREEAVFDALKRMDQIARRLGELLEDDDV